MNKLLCFGKEAFDTIIKQNGWTDENVQLFDGIGENVAFISINEPRSSYVFSNYFEESIFKNDHPNVIRLYFDDIDPIQFKKIYDKYIKKSGQLNWYIKEDKPDFWSYVAGIGTEYQRECHIFDPIQAKQLYDFIKRNLGKDFYIHCAAGVSRSQGVVMFMLDAFPEYFNKKSLNPFNKPHKLVYNKWVCNLLNKQKSLDTI